MKLVDTGETKTFYTLFDIVLEYCSHKKIIRRNTTIYVLVIDKIN